VNLIAALLHQPDVLFLDEPYQGLDYETYGQFWTHAEEARTLGRTVVVVSHMHTELDRLDALLDLRAGVVEASGPRAEEVRKGIS
jgi:ABC-2 type transport system ATP-binding protein